MISNNARMLYSAMPDRPRVTWPEGKTVAFWHAPNVEHYDWLAPEGSRFSARVTPPDAQHYMHRDSGNRVAFWRMLRAVDRYEMPSTVSLSLALLQEQPEVRDAMLERDWEIMSHGISNLRPLFGYTAEQEDRFLEISQQLALTYYDGRPIKGMLGPRISGTENTADLMVKHGMTYFADFVHDEQPRPLLTASGDRLVNVPYSFTTNDVPAVLSRNHPKEYFVDLVKAQVDRLLRDAEEDGQARVACLATHPFVMGQPNATRYLEAVFDHVRSDDRIWVTTAGQITDHYLENFYDEQVAFSRSLLEEHAGAFA
jgi:peptidoglycan/xylan/chitin deacetylase (PgdA/CDA1 family)